ncbi:hypothetical protein BRD00_14750 [Halobacteriales archaeon QS_8_69_26]|nr:MAG: hypothetical protein BRD00_14750 [Halobacteriales archaeon QS_8_69_26]
MTDDISNDSGFDRRKFLAGLGAGAAAGLAGCTDGGSDSGTATDTETDVMTTTEDGGTTTTQTETQTTTEDPGGVQPGGKPVVGLQVSPATLNPLQAGSVYSFYIINAVMLYGTTTHPETTDFEPWAFTDWELNPDNAGSDEPTIANATLRDDLEFHDGEAVTAEDYAFSAQYFREQQPTESLTAAAHNNMRGEPGDGVEVIDDQTVDIYLAQKEQRWFTNILGYPILPEHIWSDVDDFTTYSPREADEGLVGAGAWELVDFNWENWYELEPAYDTFPMAGDADWIRDDAPILDGLRFEVFGSKNQMEQAVLNGDIDAGFSAGGFTVNTAVQAQNDDQFTVHQSQESGYNHISYNLRRVPFDDVAFRQFLNKTFDKTWVVEQPYSNIGAVEGDYAVIPALESWRPPAPGEIAGQRYKSDGVDEYFDSPRQEIEMPDLSFPGEPGSFNLGEDAIQEARDFLINHPDAKHDYSFGEAQTSLTTAPDGQELYVNGEHITEAHTDNDGNGGQGPLVYSFQPPQEDLYQARYGQQQTGLLKKLGVPVEPKVKTINAQIPTVYVQEDFDMYSMGWGLGVNVTHLSSLYSSEGADLDSTLDTGKFNPMGYTGADELIFRDLEFMDFNKRQPVVRQVCAQVYKDAPTNISDVSNLLEPTNNRFTGWVGGLGTTINQDSFLNLAQTQ